MSRFYEKDTRQDKIKFHDSQSVQNPYKVKLNKFFLSEIYVTI